MEKRENAVSLCYIAEVKMRYASEMSPSKTLLWSTLEHPEQNGIVENSDKWRRRSDKSRYLWNRGYEKFMFATLTLLVKLSKEIKKIDWSFSRFHLRALVIQLNNLIRKLYHFQIKNVRTLLFIKMKWENIFLIQDNHSIVSYNVYLINACN